MTDGPFEFDLRRLVRENDRAELPLALAERIEILPLAYPDGRVSRQNPRSTNFIQIAAAVLVVAAGLVGLRVYTGSAGSSAKAFPSGEPLKIVTEANPPQSGFCLDATISAVMTRSGSEVVFDTGYLPITLPYGTKAILVDGKAELFSPDGELVATEGQTLKNLQGGALPDGRFHVCSLGAP